MASIAALSSSFAIVVHSTLAKSSFALDDNRPTLIRREWPLMRCKMLQGVANAAKLMESLRKANGRRSTGAMPTCADHLVACARWVAYPYGWRCAERPALSAARANPTSIDPG